jgi:hypothetical protein
VGLGSDLSFLRRLTGRSVQCQLACTNRFSTPCGCAHRMMCWTWRPVRARWPPRRPRGTLPSSPWTSPPSSCDGRGLTPPPHVPARGGMTPCRSTLRASTRSSAAWVCRTSRIRRPSSESLRVLRPSGRFGFTVWAAPAQSKGFRDHLRGGPTSRLVRRGPAARPELLPLRRRREVNGKPDGRRLRGRHAHDRAADLGAESAEDLLESVLHGTVRAAALLRMQPPDVLDRIRDSVRQAVEAYADGGVYRVPMPGVVFSAMRPTTA